MDAWIKEAAPSTELRKWFSHDPAKWPEFKRRYLAELKQDLEVLRPIMEAATGGKVTLLFSSSDPVHNNVAALRDFLETKKLKLPAVTTATAKRS